jgi:hypothetical protein
VNLYWGDLRGYSKLSDGRRSPDEHYEYARDTAKLDFCALTDQVDHVPAARQALMVETGWQALQAAAKRFNEPDRFVTLLACERSVPSWDNEGPASMCFYYKQDDAPFIPARHPQRDWLRRGGVRPDIEMQTLWDEHKDIDCLRAVIHSSSARHGYTWPNAPARFPVDLVEIYSKWGACEAAGAPFPVTDGSGRPPRPGGFARDALAAGFQTGFIGGSGTHFGMPGSDLWENDWANAARYDKSGLTAVYAEQLTREAIFDALKNRRCYATTCERIELDFSINHSPMGSILTGADKLRVHVRAVGTQPIKRAEVFRNGEVSHHKIGGRETFEMYFDELAPAEPTWYYVRITQSGEDCAWSSPIWVLPA